MSLPQYKPLPLTSLLQGSLDVVQLGTAPLPNTAVILLVLVTTHTCGPVEYLTAHQVDPPPSSGHDVPLLLPQHAPKAQLQNPVSQVSPPETPTKLPARITVPAATLANVFHPGFK